jgi:hypothetical protein
MSFAYTVPGLVPVIRQPSALVCWATAYTILRSWKDQTSFNIRSAVALVDEKYGVMVDDNRAMPSTEFTLFLQKARMQHQPMWNIAINEWYSLLVRRGLLWVGTLGVVSPGIYLHSRIIEGMYGDGNADNTWVKIIDPENGSRYDERFRDFLTRYEGAFNLSQRGVGRGLMDYYQIRYF